MSRKINVFCYITLFLVLITTCVLAATWFCPECGKNNEGNFCPNCGEKKPIETTTSQAGIGDIQCKVQDNGDVLVTWNDRSNMTPYTITYQAQNHNGEEDGISSKKTILQFLIPNETYTITVRNSKSSASTKFTIPLKVFTEFSSTSKKIVVPDSVFSISEVQQDKTKEFEVQFHYPLLKKDRSYKGKLVTQTPYGYGGYVWVWDPFDLEAQYSYIYSTFSVYELFEGIKRDFDEIPTGRYLFEMYFDGLLYASCRFDVIK